MDSYNFPNLSYIFNSSSVIHFSFGCNLSGKFFIIFLYSFKLLLSMNILFDRLLLELLLFILFCLLFSNSSLTNEFSCKIFKASLFIKF